MAVTVKKYNPGFLSDDEIVESFCVRTSELESILESLRESTRSSNPHTLVVGPRGSGKTHLLLRVAAEVRRDESLAWLFPVTFAEESYEVGTCGEFWLEGLSQLVEQAPAGEQDSLRLTYNDLRTVQDDRVLAERCIGTLLDFADRHKKRLLLLVENLNMLFRDISDPDVGWQLRKTLQTEPRIILLGSATSRFEEIDSPERALYDLFRVVTLRPLDTNECEVLWRTVSGKTSSTRAVRPLEILTGGNTRLLTIIARFGSGQSFGELMRKLLDLVDEHTEYFRSHLEALPPQERRVYLGLARLWKPSTAREIADLARLDTNKCSALLGRLVQRGAVVVEGGTPRRREYYLTERLYNIYYLLRRGGGADRLVKALIDFMVCLYSPTELGEIIGRIYEENNAPDVLLQHVTEQVADVLTSRALSLARTGQTEEALHIFDQIIETQHATGIDFRVAVALAGKSALLIQADRCEEAIAVGNELVRRFGTHKEPEFELLTIFALFGRGLALLMQGNAVDAIEAFDQAFAAGCLSWAPPLNSFMAEMMLIRGWALIQSNQSDKAAEAFDHVVTRCGVAKEPELTKMVVRALIGKTAALAQMGRTISEREFSRLLEYFAKDEQLWASCVQVSILFAAAVAPARALEIIAASPAAPLFLPLVTALKLELGQETQVAKEVEEVALDIRHRLVELRGKLQSDNPTLNIGVTVSNHVNNLMFLT